MKRYSLVMALALLGMAPVLSDPIVPQIIGHDFNFGAWEPVDTPFFDPRDGLPDYLTLAGDPLDREVTAYWEVWPVGGTPIPIFNDANQFGGDLQLYLQFDGAVYPPDPFGVSITGSGREPGADMYVWGRMPDLGINSYELIVSVEVEAAALYGYAEQSTFALDTTGYFDYVNPMLPNAADLIGQPAVTRGHIDFQTIQLPLRYDPMAEWNIPPDGGGYSGELGLGIPEPSALILLGLGAVVFVRRRV